MDPVETGRRVRAARAYADMNLPELAEEVGIGRSTLIEIEKGRRSPKKWELFAIAQVCGVPDEWFSEESPATEGDQALARAASRQRQSVLRESEEPSSEDQTGPDQQPSTGSEEATG